MPIYEYQCQKCGKIFEAFQRSGEKPKMKCQFCSGKVKRIISPAGFILKGAGFYVNDYPSESRKRGMESEKKKAKPKPTGPKEEGSKEVAKSSAMT
jgi:putative FmdB family regulatory protein